MNFRCHTTLLIFVSLFLFFQFSGTLKSQTFSISELDASGFPWIRASFVALNAAGNNYEDIAVDDFNVTENMQSMNASLEVECWDEVKNPEVSVLIILDQSGSMGFIDTLTGETRWKWVKEGVRAFINTIHFEGRTAIALTSFGKYAMFRCPFTNDKDRLFDSLNNIPVVGATEYEPPFIQENVGAVDMLKTRPSDMRRIVVFLTDGNPNHEPDQLKIVDSLNNYNIQVYAITLTMPMHSKLEYISKETGGKSYEVYTKEELNNIYKYIALDIQSKRICELRWKSPFGCDEFSRTRDVYIKFTRNNRDVSRTFLAPENSIASIEVYDDINAFGNPPVNTSAPSKTITIMPEQTAMNIEEIKILPSEQYFKIIDDGVDSYPFLLDSGQTHDVVVQFTQGAVKDFRQAALMFEGSPCPAQATLIGGYSQVLITNPEGGEIKSTCDRVVIEWAGVEADVPVNLSYSTNGGGSWNTIANNRRNLSYTWNPGFEAENVIIKAEVSEQQLYQWASGLTGPDNIVSTSLAVTKDDMNVYVVGHFEGDAHFGEDTLTSKGGYDIFVSKFDTQEGGFVWSDRAGGRDGNDSAMGVCVDKMGNAFVTGICYQGAQFGTITPNIQEAGVPYCYVARYPAGGGYPKVTLLGAIDVYTKFEARGLRIKIDTIKDEIIIKGQYLNTYNYQGYSLPRSDRPAYFIATFNSDLRLSGLEKSNTDYPDWSSDTDYDSEGSRFQTGNFTNSIAFGNHTVNGEANTDSWVNKYGRVPGSEDISEAFDIIQPVLEFTEASPLDLGDCTLGDNCPVGFNQIVANIKNIDETIEGYRIVDKNGNPSSDFTLQDIAGTNLKAMSELNLEFGFAPQATGVREGTLIIDCDCAESISIDLIGNGVCSAQAVDTVDMGTQNTGFTKKQIETCIFKNTNPATIRIQPTIEGDNPGDFKVTFPDGTPCGTFPVEAGECVDLQVWFTPTVPGPRSAYINYNMPEGCQEPITYLIGVGINADILALPINWEDRKVLGTYDSVLVVNNNSVLNAAINSISLKGGADDSYFTIDTETGTVNANDKFEIPVSFKPVDERYYSATVVIDIESMDEPLEVLIEGTGVLPKINPTWICDNPVKPGETSTAYLRIENPSQSAPLYIESLAFETATSDYSWPGGTAPAGVTIDKEDFFDFPVDFTPQDAGTRTVNIIVKSDANTGAEEYPQVDLVEANCDALGVAVTNPVESGVALLCTTVQNIPVTVTNSGGSTELIVSDYYFTGADSTAFEVFISDDFAVPGGDDNTFHVSFSPTEDRDYSCFLHLVNSFDEELTAELKGTGDIIHLSVSDNLVAAEPSKYGKFSVYAEIQELANNPLTEMTLQIIYNPEMLSYNHVEGSSFKNKLSNWTWNDPFVESPGTLTISGSGTLNTSFDGHLFDVFMQYFLCDTDTSDVMLKPVHSDCETTAEKVTEAEIINICFRDGRLITINSDDYDLAPPAPNPAVEKSTLKFSVGLEAHTTIELVNTMGKTERVLIEEVLSPGKYELNLPIDELSSGVYMIKMISGPFRSSAQLVISK